MQNVYWKRTTGTLIGAMWLYTLAGIAASIASAVNFFVNPSMLQDIMQSLMDGELPGKPGVGDMVEDVFNVLVLVGYYLFFRSLTRFSLLQKHAPDRDRVGRIRTAYILMVIALLAGFIPLIGWLAAFVLMIVAYAKMIFGYAGLKKSPTFPEGARRGASTLFACSIWLLVGYVLGGIPVIGDIIEGLIAFVVFFVMLSAWGTIKAAAPDMTAEEEAAFRATEVPVHKQRLGDGLVAFFLTVFIARLFTFIYDISSLGFFYECVVQLIILGIFIWLLASLRSRLHVVSLIGLILILVNVLESIVVYSFIAYDPSSIPTLLGNAIINISMTVAYLAGMMLFVWGSYCSLGIKVTITAYVVLSEIVSRALPIVTSEFLSELEPEKINMVYRLTITAIAAVFLVLTFIFVSLWKKEPERTDATATYVHA